jgi:type II secretory pathway pseudopilin PulG
MKKPGGTSLLELIIVIIIFSIIAIGSIEIIGLGLKSYLRSTALLAVDWQGRIANERITRDLHTIRSRSSATIDSPISIALPDKLTFKDYNNKNITFEVIGGQLKRNNKLLAYNIQSITFAYYNRDGTLLTQPITDKAIIRYISFSLVVKQNGHTHTIKNGVYLWSRK